MKYLRIIIGLSVFLFLLSNITPVYAEITKFSDISVKILYDNSGSMFPGYCIEGCPGRTKSGAKFFYKYEKFRKWLKEFIDDQTQFNAKQVSLHAFTIPRNRRPKYTKLLNSTRIDDIKKQTLAQAFENIPKFGQFTMLKEAVEYFTHDFEGIIWLITDNIIDTREGKPDHNDIKNFFRTLNEDNRYHALHMYKHKFNDHKANVSSNLAIYGILVSSGHISRKTVEFYDKKLFAFRREFGNEHLKLKDLSVNAIVLKPDTMETEPLEVSLEDRNRGWFDDSQRVNLILRGEIMNKMTQHKVTSGKYNISISSSFHPSKADRKNYGLKSISSRKFVTITGSISTIEPNKSQKLKEIICSKENISIVSSGLLGVLKLAFGKTIKYTGKAKIVFSDLHFTLERSRLKGIYGISEVEDIFDIKQIVDIENSIQEDVQLEFILKTSSSKGYFLIFVLLIFIGLIGALCALFFNKIKCHVKMNQKEDNIALIRLGKYHIYQDLNHIGTLKRDLFTTFIFSPNESQADINVKQSSKKTGKFDVYIKGKPFELNIKPYGGKKLIVKWENNQQETGRPPTKMFKTAIPGPGLVSVKPKGPGISSPTITSSNKPKKNMPGVKPPKPR